MSSDKLRIYVPAMTLAVLAFALAFQFVDPAPPSSLTFSAGQKGGAYYAYAEELYDLRLHLALVREQVEKVRDKI